MDTTNNPNQRDSSGLHPKHHSSLNLDDAVLQNIVIGGRYEILRLLGEGGMSLVYLIKHTELKKLLALKILRPIAAEDVSLVKRFQREAQAASSLDHPNITNIYDYGIEDGYPYIVMDYLEGMSLASVIEKDGALPVRWLIGILLQICDAFEYMHNHGVVHRDLKPSNVMLTEGSSGPNFVKVFDFGIAKLLPQSRLQCEPLTLDGEVFGSPLYMSPEQCRGQNVDQRSDIYSMGALMYEALTGHPPFADANPRNVMRSQLMDMPPHLKDAIADKAFGRALEDIVFKAMRKEPESRYQTMGELKAALEAVNTHKPGKWKGFFSAWSKG